jgi:hypothetical protein
LQAKAEAFALLIYRGGSMSNKMPLILSNGYFSADEHNQYASFDHVLKAGVTFRFGTYRHRPGTTANDFYYLIIQSEYHPKKGLHWVARAETGGNTKEVPVGDVTLDKLEIIAITLYNLSKNVSQRYDNLADNLKLIQHWFHTDLKQLRDDYQRAIELIDNQAKKDNVLIDAQAEVNRIIREVDVELLLNTTNFR